MDGKVVIGTELNTKSFDAQIKQLESKLKLLEKSADESNIPEKFRRSADEARELNVEIEKTRNQLGRLYEKQAKINNQGFENTRKEVNEVGKSISNVIKKVSRWALAVFGVRSAYLAIRSAMSILSESDETLKTNIDYIRWALANTLKPIIEWIIKAVYTILQLIGQVIQVFTGYNIFKDSGIKDYQKAMAKSNKSAKELKKTISSFDEINILSSNGSNDTSTTPTQNLSNIGQTPEWMNNLIKIKDFILEIAPIVAIIFAILGKIKKLGLYIAIYGIYKIFKEFKKWLKEPTFENFMGVLQGIEILISGIAIMFGAWPVAVGAALALILTTIIKNWDDIKDAVKNGVRWVKEWLENNFGVIGQIIGGVFEGAVDLIIIAFENLIQPIKRIYDGIIKITQGDFVEGIKDIFGGIFDLLTWPFRTFIDWIKNLWNNYIKKPIESIVNNIKKALGFKVDMEYKFTAAGGGGGSFGGGGSGGGFRAKGGVFYPSKLPKLAVGGIINNPGAGVYYNGATIGERGAEAVVPLTDSQQMALLGEAIGKYITVNLTNVTELDGRTIARKVQEVNNGTNFLLNR